MDAKETLDRVKELLDSGKTDEADLLLLDLQIYAVKTGHAVPHHLWQLEDELRNEIKDRQSLRAFSWGAAT